MSAITRVSWRDLLARSFTEMDCWSQAREIGKRCGLLVPEWPEREREDPRGVLTPVLEYVGATASCATRLCDLIVSDPTDLGWPSHVATLVDERERVAISTSVKHGPYAWPALRHPCSYGVWRPKITLDGGAFEDAPCRYDERNARGCER